jgi:putative hemolysin
MFCVGDKEPEISIRDLWTGASSLPKPARDWWDRLLSLDRLQDLYRSTRNGQSGSFPLRLLRQLNIECEIEDADLEHVPRSGPVVAVVNHPHGLLDGALVGSTFLSVRPDVKIMTNRLLASVHEIEQHCIFVDPFGRLDAVGRNLRSLRQALDWLSAGKLFGYVSSR